MFDWSSFALQVLATFIALLPIELTVLILLVKYVLPVVKRLRPFTESLTREQTDLLVKRLQRIAEKEIELEKQYGENEP